MKKIIIAVLLTAMLIAVVSCASKNASDVNSNPASETDTSAETQAEFRAEILEINGNSILVEPLQGEDILRSSDKISFGAVDLDNIGAEVGDIVSVAYNGIIMESYPAQITALKWSMFEKADECSSEISSTQPVSRYLPSSNAQISSNEQSLDQSSRGEMMAKKPVIYLYPERACDISVCLEYNGRLNFTYPEYNGGWNVVAYPDGKIVNKADGKEYSYLFWEGTSSTRYDLSRGFVVKGCDTVKFLRDKLEFMGLTPKEYNEFIVYWAPLMENNPYNLIAFQGKQYTDSAILKISPEPDSILRVFMSYKPMTKYVKIPRQELSAFNRKGFVVVEWGGTEVK